MIHKNLTPYLWGPRVTARKPREPEMVVCVRGVFRLAPDAPLEAIEDPMEQGFMSGEAFADDDLDQTGPSVRGDDFAEWKMHGEFLLKGSCYPPGGPARECTVRARVGDWQKSIRVVGPRVYKRGLLLGGSAGEPQPFRSMPLSWENAYGGDGYRKNPAGLGYVGEELPMLEMPDQPIKKTGVRDRAPATFLPISSNWPQRAGKRGKNYGASWKKTRAPFYSDDFDWTYCQAAAPDQWIDGYWRGDEEIELENLHPQAPNWTTKLPGLRIRAFVRTTDDRIFEPEMNLDTITAEIEDGKLCLIWRGHAPIQEIDMSDVATVLIAQERLADEPADPQTYITQLEAFEADPVGFNANLPPGFAMVTEAIEAAEQAELNGTPMPDLKAVAESLPAGCPFPPWFLAAAAGDEDPLGVLAGLPEGLADGDPAAGQGAIVGKLADPGEQSKMMEDIAKLKDDPSKVPAVLEGVAAMLPPDVQGGFKQGLAAMQQAFAAAEASAGDGGLGAIAQAGAGSAPTPAAESLASDVNTLQGAVGDAASGAADVADSTTMAGQAGDGLAKVPTLDDAVAETMKGLEEFEMPELPDMSGTEEQLAAETAKLDLEEARMRKKFGDHPLLGLYDHSRALIENAPRPADVAPDMSPLPLAMQGVYDSLAAQGIGAAAMAPLAAAIAKVKTTVEALPQPAPLPEGEFAGQNLRGRDFSGQDLTGQVFCKADLTGANFKGATLTEADFRKADLTQADLSGAVLEDANLRGATLTKARLVDIRGARANLRDAELGQADLTGADLTGAMLQSMRGEKSCFQKARLDDANARFCELGKVDLRDASLLRANLAFAVLNLVKADGADFTDANLDIAKLTKCRLHGASLRNSSCAMTQFTGSNFTDAVLEGSTHDRSDFTKTVLDRAQLGSATLRGSIFRDVTATGADFQRADVGGLSATGKTKLLECNFQHAEGPRSVWLEVDLSGSTFRHGSFPDAFFQDASGSDVDFMASVMKRTNFRKVVLERPAFVGADLGGAVFQDARLDDGDFRHSNCYDAKFLGAKAARCRFDDAFLVGVQLDDPDAGMPGGELPGGNS